ALDVPARPAASPRAVPAGDLRRRWLPQYEVARIALVGRHVDARARQQLVWRVSGQLSIRRETWHGEQHVPLSLIRMARGDEALDKLDHLGDVPCGARLLIR